MREGRYGGIWEGRPIRHLSLEAIAVLHTFISSSSNDTRKSSWLFHVACKPPVYLIRLKILSFRQSSNQVSTISAITSRTALMKLPHRLPQSWASKNHQSQTLFVPLSSPTVDTGLRLKTSGPSPASL